MLGLYADENFPLLVVEELRRLGFDVLTMYEDDKANQSLTDEVVLSIASDKQRALLTANHRYFIQLHRRQPNHKGVIVRTFDPDFTGQAQRIADAIEKQSELAGTAHTDISSCVNGTLLTHALIPESRSAVEFYLT